MRIFLYAWALTTLLITAELRAQRYHCALLEPGCWLRAPPAVVPQAPVGGNPRRWA